MQVGTLLERDDDLADLARGLNLAGAEGAQIALVSGEAGIGKTSLVEHFVRHCAPGERILRGYCEPLLTPTALGPLNDIARQIGGRVADLLADSAALPVIFETLLSTLQAGDRATVVIIEDIHWADEPTLDLIKYLGRRLQASPVLLIVTFRDDAIARQPSLRALLGVLASRPNVMRVSPKRLSPNAVAAMARGQVRDTDALFRQTGGNPFFVSEVIAGPAAGVPTTVRDAVLSRASQMGLKGRSVLNVAAIVGARIEYEVLEHLSMDVEAGLSECIAQGLLLDVGTGVAFRHELARDAVLEAIDPLVRRRLYRQVLAAAIAAGFEAQGLFARLAHYSEGSASAEDVVRFGQAAGQAAKALGAHREAAAHFESVLRFSSGCSPRERAGYYLAFAHECAILDRLANAIDGYRAAVAICAEMGDDLRRGEALSGLAWPLVRSGENAEAEAVTAAAVNLLEPLGASVALANAYRTLAHLRMLDRDKAQAVAVGEKAIALATALDDMPVLAASEMVVGAARLVTDDASGRIHLERALALSEQHGLDETVALVQVNLGSSYGEQYHFADAERELTKGLRFTTEHDLNHSGHYLSAWLALTEFFTGRWDAAKARAEALCGQPDVSAVSRIMGLVALGRVLVRRGDDGAGPVLDEALRMAGRTQTLQRLAPVHEARAELAWFRGDQDAVGREVDAVLSLAEARRHAWHVGELLYWRRQSGQDVTVDVVAALPYRLQLTGDWRGAAGAWRDRLCPYEEARALSEGDHAAQMRALEIFDGLNARPAAALLRQAMRKAGVEHIPRGPRASTKRNPFGLTTRELATLAHLARQKSNAQIAEALFISGKTVDHHVSSILAKLGVRSRGEAAGMALREGLVTQNGEGPGAK